MANEPVTRWARLDKQELADLSAQGSDQERGRLLRRLLREKGIDPNRLYRVEYHPHRLCWLLTQETAPGGHSAPGMADDLFYLQALTELRRTARTAFAAVAARSSHFANFGRPYQLPTEPEPQPLAPRDLANLLGGTNAPPARFDSEGGWEPELSPN
jgi:hypothetical protein